MPLVDRLKELGIDEITLIIFSGDNSSSFSPESQIGSLFKQEGNGLRGYKRGRYAGALRRLRPRAGQGSRRARLRRTMGLLMPKKRPKPEKNTGSQP